MKTKIIPFDLETAKKIQAGKIEGVVLDKDNFGGTIITTNGVNTPLPVGIKFPFPKGDNIIFFDIDGKNAKGDKLVLEVPDDTPQFKPYDKVLVRDGNDTKWIPVFYGYYDKYNSPFIHICADGECWKQCIPYEGNEHLVGTTYKPKEE